MRRDLERPVAAAFCAHCSLLLIIKMITTVLYYPHVCLKVKYPPEEEAFERQTCPFRSVTVPLTEKEGDHVTRAGC